MDLRTTRQCHMNTYLGVGTSQGKIIPVKHHFSGLIFGNFETLCEKVTSFYGTTSEVHITFSVDLVSPTKHWH